MRAARAARCGARLLPRRRAATASARQLTILQDDAVFSGLSRTIPRQGDGGGQGARRRHGARLRGVEPGVARSRTRARSRAASTVGEPRLARLRLEHLRRVRGARAPARPEALSSPSRRRCPYWASEEPAGCPHTDRRLLLPRARPATGSPSPRCSASSREAVARRYAQRVRRRGHLYSIWNEPNLEHYLFPQVEGRRGGRDGGLCGQAVPQPVVRGLEGDRRDDPPMRGKVLFGETAAISSPLDTLFAALCLDQNGRPFRTASAPAPGLQPAAAAPDRRRRDPPVQQPRERLRLQRAPTRATRMRWPTSPACTG